MGCNWKVRFLRDRLDGLYDEQIKRSSSGLWRRPASRAATTPFAGPVAFRLGSCLRFRLHRVPQTSWL
jgi:hypothetical protein